MNSANPVAKLTASQVSDYYFKKSRTWANGEPVRFFDRLDGSEERAEFLSTVLKRSAREVDSFWIGQKLYTGDSAPVQVDSNTTVVNLVSRFPGAVGYTSTAPIDTSGVKVIQVDGSNP